MANEDFGSAIKAARKQNALSQTELATKIGVTQATISNWEKGKKELDGDIVAKLKTVLGEHFIARDASGAEGPSVLAAWLSKNRQHAGMTVAQLAEKSGLSIPTIYGIEAGRAENPRRRTIDLLEKALVKKFEHEFQEEVRQASTIEGIGEFQDFDPYSRDDWPGEAGVYVFYDIAGRPLYVGMADDISDRIRGHHDRFWFKQPIVQGAAYIPIKDKKLRKQIETVLIKFLKNNAILNKQGVERD
jgi:transcriptional regulator with XRE-family HTH domain